VTLRGQPLELTPGPAGPRWGRPHLEEGIKGGAADQGLEVAQEEEALLVGHVREDGVGVNTWRDGGGGEGAEGGRTWRKASKAGQPTARSKVSRNSWPFSYGTRENTESGSTPEERETGSGE
jgi:hypothetical protein